MEKLKKIFNTHMLPLRKDHSTPKESLMSPLDKLLDLVVHKPGIQVDLKKGAKIARRFCSFEVN